MRRLRAVSVLLALVLAAAALFRIVFFVMDLGASRGDRVVVGSKAFTESVILGEILAEWIEARASLRVERRFDLGGTNVCYEALRSGALDLYPEYTGTGLMAILHDAPMTDPAAVLTHVRARCLSRDAVEWLAPLGFNNSYALAVSQRLATRDGLHTISDLRAHSEYVYGLATEFLARADGWPGLRARYGLAPETPPRSMEAGLMYEAAAGGQVDVISAYSTDGRIPSLGLVVLDDDRHFFPPYQAVPIVRAATLARHPQLGPVLRELSGRIDDATMRAMNASVDVQHRSAVDVARAFVRQQLAQRR